jgi:DNA-binding transcriptional MerR regulator
LARRTGLRTSALRYYEELGLLFPTGRTASGYRLYDPEAEQTVRFIQQAQRLGFSLNDIRALLSGVRQETLSDETVVQIAERRLLDLERRLTELLVVHHEMESFVLELGKAVHHADPSDESFFDRMIGQVCAHPPGQLRADSILDWLMAQTRCALGIADAGAALDALRGQHVHIWEKDDGYQILIVSQDPAVESALQALAQLEATCHAHPSPQLERHREGLLFTTSGENAFIFARLFLALERE